MRIFADHQLSELLEVRNPFKEQDTLDDLADLATDELIAKKRSENRRGPARERSERAEDKGGVLGEYGLTEEQGNEIIMAARAHWFEDEEPAPAASSDSQEAAHADSEQ